MFQSSWVPHCRWHVRGTSRLACLPVLKRDGGVSLCICLCFLHFHCVVASVSHFACGRVICSFLSFIKLLIWSTVATLIELAQGYVFKTEGGLTGIMGIPLELKDFFLTFIVWLSPSILSNSCDSVFIGHPCAATPNVHAELISATFRHILCFNRGMLAQNLFDVPKPCETWSKLQESQRTSKEGQCLQHIS